MVMRSQTTDGRSAFKCQGKWPDQLLTHRFGLSTLRQRVRAAHLPCQNARKAQKFTLSTVHMGNPGYNGFKPEFPVSSEPEALEDVGGVAGCG